MKVLVIYFSQSGNTEKIAEAIFKEASRKDEATLKKIEDVDPTALRGYEHVFLGSPIHARRIANEVKVFLEKMPSLPNLTLAGFITHAAPAYPQQDIDEMCRPFVDACKDKEMAYAGSFDCQGYLADSMHDAVQKMQQVYDSAWAEKVAQMTGHPDADDVAAAKAFARAVLNGMG